MKEDIAPLRGEGINTMKSPWEGSDEKKPWHYKVTAAIPCADTFECTEIAVNCLRYQTERPFILIIDVGSQGDQAEKIKELHASDCEVHFIRLNGVQHPSDFPAMAMDIAFTLCRTDFMFATHADCFLRNRNFLKELMEMTLDKSPVVGYQMSPRAHNDWKGMVSHTATMFHMPTMDRIGAGWSMRRLANMYNLGSYKPSPLRPNFPDTEILINYIFRYNKIKPHLIGEEKNFERQVDENIDHIRSYTSGKMYSPPYFAQAQGWFETAKKEAMERIRQWKLDDGEY